MASEVQPWQGAAYPGAPSTVAEATRAGVPLRVPRWGLLDIGVLVIGGMIVPIVLLSVALVAGVPQGGGTFLLLAAMSPWVAFVGWPLLTTHLQGNGIRIDLGYEFRVSDIWWGIGGGVACFVLATPVGWLTEQIFGDFGSAAGDAAADAHTSRAVLVVYALFVLVGAPLAEELAFRGLVFTAIAKYVGTRGGSATRALTWAAVWSSVIFAGIHLEPVRAPILLVIGLVLAFLRARTGRTGAGVIAHALNNLPGAIAIAMLAT